MKGLATSADGVDIQFEVHGAGSPAIMLVHGWSCDRSYWAQQVTDLAEHFQVVAVDLAGHGESGQNRQTWSMASFGEDVVAVVKQLGLEQVVLIGHSMGGHVIAEAALRLPYTVLGLIVIDWFKDVSRSMTRNEVDAFLAPFQANFREGMRQFAQNGFSPKSDPALGQATFEKMAARPPQIAIPVADELLSNGDHLWARLHEINAPIVLINLDHSPTNISAAEQYGIKVELVSGAGHFLMMEIPEIVNPWLHQLVLEFANRNPAAG